MPVDITVRSGLEEEGKRRGELKSLEPMQEQGLGPNGGVKKYMENESRDDSKTPTVGQWTVVIVGR